MVHFLAILFLLFGLLATNATALTPSLNHVGCEQKIEDDMNQGGLFARDYLIYGIRDAKAWKNFKQEDLAALEADLKSIFAKFPTSSTPNESRTEKDLIWKVVERLGWQHYTTQDNLAASGRANVPDGLLFEDADTKARADKLVQPAAKFEIGACILEAKKWQRPLDRAGKSRDESETPSSQMLRYLRRADDLTNGTLRWGMLTNGRHWRLYFQGAKSVSEGYCELDLPAILGIDGFADLTSPLTVEDRQHWLKVFALVFRRESFFRDEGESQTFHQTALEKGRYYEEGVAKDLSKVVFETVFPGLVRAIAAHDSAKPAFPKSDYLIEVKESALILLYRLLFVLYAEDRNLLPVESSKYDDYGLRKPVRNHIANRIDTADTFSDRRTTYWNQTTGLFEGIAKGDRAIGLPPYNGGLFDLASTPLLERVKLPDSVFAPLMDGLCRVEREGKRRYINYRDLGVRQLGSIYERLLEHEVFEAAGVLDIRLNPFARKGSGSYYTPDELVRLIIERTVGPLVDERVEAFNAIAKKKPKGVTLEDKDPATEILNLKVCDPAMGSGHFLVDLVDYLADEVLIATEAAAEAVEDYRSPLLARIAAIRD